MENNLINESDVSFKNKLSTKLLMWFLIIAITPLTIISTINYYQLRNNLQESIVESLHATAELKTEFIDNWFNYRFLDLQSQSNNKDNVDFLEELSEAYKQSNSPLDRFVKSNNWNKIVDKNKNDLASLQKTYGYYDIFLISLNGDILFTLINESDLGSNLFSGEYSKTLFSKASKKSLQTEMPTFSDLESYKPSNGSVSGFIISPLVDENDAQVGLIAFQMQIEQIDNIMQNRTGLGKTGETLLVGTDFNIRSNSSLYNHEALDCVITTDIVKLWYVEHISKAFPHFSEKEEALSYINHNNTNVIGLHHPIEIADIKWVVISEITSDEAFAPIKEQAYLSIGLFVITILILLTIVIRLTGKIVKPIEKLTSIAENATNGDNIDKIDISTKDEIGILASTFNHMLNIQNENKDNLMEYTIDLKESKREQEEISHNLAKAIAELERSNEELDDFAYIASHDLKEPLRGLHNYSQFLLEDYEDKLDEDGKHKLKTLVNLTIRMETLINSLLEFSRLGRVDLAIKDVDLNIVVNDVLETLAIRLKEENVTIQIPEKLPIIVCDSVKIAELYRNLITNAMKYNDKEDKRITIGYEENNREFHKNYLYVQDNGIGIKENHIGSIFRIFKRLHGKDKYGGGTGAGLTIVKKIIDRHGGEIWTKSIVNEGTIFLFTLNGDLNNDNSKRIRTINADNLVS